MATEFIKVIDPDNGDGTDYLSVDAWEDDLGGTTGGDLVGDDEIAIAQCRSSSGGDDTAEVDINGWASTSATNYIKATGTDFPADGVLDETKYLLHVTDTGNSHCIWIHEDDVWLEKLQLKHTGSDTGGHRGVEANSSGTAMDNVSIDSCYILGVQSGSGSCAGILALQSTNAIAVNAYNCIIEDWKNGADTSFRGAYAYGASATLNVWNCTIWGCYYGTYEAGSGSIVAVNCISGNNDDDFCAGSSVDYCCSDDGSGTNAQQPVNGADDWDADLVDPGTDFDLLAGSNCVGNGTDDPGGGEYSDDIVDAARSSTWDIGAFEYAAAGAVAPTSVLSGSLVGSLGGPI